MTLKREVELPTRGMTEAQYGFRVFCGTLLGVGLGLVMMTVLLAACGDGPEEFVPAANGEACMADFECENGVCLENLDTIVFPDGMCTKECSFVPPTGCAETEICLQHNGVEVTTLCYQRCAVDLDCREGYTCQGLFWRACLPAPE